MKQRTTRSPHNLPSYMRHIPFYSYFNISFFHNTISSKSLIKKPNVILNNTSFNFFSKYHKLLHFHPLTFEKLDNMELLTRVIKPTCGLYNNVSKEYWICPLSVCILIDLALVFLELWMFKICWTIDISKIAFFDFSGTEMVKKNLKTN